MRKASSIVLTVIFTLSTSLPAYAKGGGDARKRRTCLGTDRRKVVDFPKLHEQFKEHFKNDYDEETDNRFCEWLHNALKDGDTEAMFCYSGKCDGPDPDLEGPVRRSGLAPVRRETTRIVEEARVPREDSGGGFNLDGKLIGGLLLGGLGGFLLGRATAPQQQPQPMFPMGPWANQGQLVPFGGRPTLMPQPYNQFGQNTQLPVMPWPGGANINGVPQFGANYGTAYGSSFVGGGNYSVAPAILSPVPQTPGYSLIGR